MYVGWNMKTSLLTVTPETSVFKAREMMDAHRISHLPVTDGKAHLVGIVTDRDLKEAWASPATTLSVHELTYALQKLTVANIMTRKVITTAPDVTIERAGRIMHDNKIGALPVVKDNRLVGIITVTDLLEVLLDALGVGENTRRFSLLARDRVGVMGEVGRLMQEAGINIRSTISMPLKEQQNIWHMMLRIDEGNYDKAVATLKGAGFMVITDYVQDLTPYLPK